MKKAPQLVTIFSSLLLSLSVVAQNDSTRLDAGSLVLKRAFTQHISIKGEDLEKMPFSNLTDAINVWLSGVYTISGNLIFVVDGNIISDVNAYSVHDIEEVVFLQHAGALAGTAGTQQEMVLITTRKYKDKLRMRGAAQTFLVHSPGAATNLYHQYYAGVDANYDKFSAGVSANYLRDVSPMVKRADLHVNDPYNLDRWRLNGNFAWRPDTKNTVEIHVGYVPQTMDSSQSYLPSGSAVLNYTERGHESAQQFNTWARWTGEWAPGLRNDLQVGYLHLTQKGTANYDGHYTDNTNYIADAGNADLHTHQIFVRDRLSYTVHAGDWILEPSINASYNYVKETYRQTLLYQSSSSPGGGQGSGPTSGTSSQNEGGGGYKLWVLTPTLDISYKDVLNIQGGVTANVSKKNAEDVGQPTLPRTVAFGSIGIDVLRLDGTHHKNSLKIFGSYARRSAYFVNDFYLNDLDGANPAFKYGLNTSPQTVIFSSGTPGIPVLNSVITLPKYWVWETGARWATLQNRLQIDYNFQQRNFSTVLGSDIGGGATGYFLTEMKSSQHRLGVSYRILDRADLSWQSGLNVSRIGTAITGERPMGVSLEWIDKPTYTGGWVNRVQCHRLSLGMDLLYHVGNVVYFDGNSYMESQDDLWLSQNIYAGYKLPMPKKIGLELYADSRGLVRGGGGSKGYLITPGRYYGVGGKISL